MADGGTALTQHWVNVSSMHECQSRRYMTFCAQKPEPDGGRPAGPKMSNVLLHNHDRSLYQENDNYTEMIDM